MEKHGDKTVAKAHETGNLSVSRRRDLNPRPADYESAAPPAKLRRHVSGGISCFLKKHVLSFFHNTFEPFGVIEY